MSFAERVSIAVPVFLLGCMSLIGFVYVDWPPSGRRIDRIMADAFGWIFVAAVIASGATMLGWTGLVAR